MNPDETPHVTVRPRVDRLRFQSLSVYAHRGHAGLGTGVLRTDGTQRLTLE